MVTVGAVVSSGAGLMGTAAIAQGLDPDAVQLIVTEPPVAGLVLAAPPALDILLVHSRVWLVLLVSVGGGAPPINTVSNTSSSPLSPVKVTLGVVLVVPAPAGVPRGVV